MRIGITGQGSGFRASRRAFASGLLLLACWALTACHSSHIDVTVQNRTGAAIRLLEVDYPSASFGTDTLSDGATLHYRIQVQGKGQLKVQYTGGNGTPAQITGPELTQSQEGALSIVLLPAGKAEFQPQLKAAE